MSVVSLGVKLLSRGSLSEHSIAIYVDLLVGELHGDLLRFGWLVLGVDVLLHGELLLGHVHVDPLGLGAGVLGGDDEAVLEYRRR